MLLFGAPGLVRGPDDSEIRALQPKRAAVLSYLVAARPGPLHRRDTLLAMFWPEHDADRGRNALSKVIHHLRRSLPPETIVTQGDQIGVARERLWCDVTAFEQALEGGRTEEALALYRGDLLQGFHIPGAPDFDHWSDVERARLRRMAVASAWDVASEAEVAGDGARATKFARQAVEWAPRDESGFRRLLALLQSRGNRAEALEAFDTFARELRRDYGVDPSGPTLELVEAIRDGSLAYDLVPPLALGSERGSTARGTRDSGTRDKDPDPSVDEEPDEAREPEPRDGAAIEAAPRAPQGSRPRRRWALATLAMGSIGLVAFSLSRGEESSVIENGGSAGAVLVTEFDDGTPEGLGATVSEALRIDLARSAGLDLIDRVDVAGTLELMGLESGALISADVGREIAVRDGLAAVVDGAIVPAGAGYILTAAIREGGDGRTLASFRSSVAEPEQMIAAIDELSRGIREALGEQLGTIEADLPLERVTTSSLEALTLYTRAIDVFDRRDDRPLAASLLQRAVALDPGFAMAWRMLAVALQNDTNQALRMEALRQAYHHRDRLSELERHLVEASYYSTVAENRGQAVESLLRILALDPDHVAALNNLGINYLFMGEVERAEGAFERLAKNPATSSTAYRNLVDTRLSLGRAEGASQALAAFEQAYPDHELLPSLRARTRFLSGAVDEARVELRRVIDDPLWPTPRRADALGLLGRMAYWEGNHEEGRAGLLEAERVDALADEAAVWARVVGTAYTSALVGDVAWARDHIDTRLETGLAEGVLLDQGVAMSLIELSALTSATGPAMTHAAGRVPRFASAYARIEAGDTVGLREIIAELPLHLFQRVLLSEQLGDLDRSIELYEKILEPGYTGWGNTPQRLRALMRLGPLYEESGDTLRAIEAYDALAQRWALGDERGRAAAERSTARARALEASTLQIGGHDPG